MAASAASHARSISWPDDVHPLTRTIQDHLLTLTQPQSSVRRKLGVLKYLYEVVDDFLRLPMTHEASSDLEDVSEGFLRVLDICSTARDVFLQTKEDIRELESTLRRRSKSGDQEALAREIDAYMYRRRGLSRTISRYAKPVPKGTEKKRDSRHDVLREVQETSFTVFVSLLFLLSRSNKQRSKHKVWNLLSKMFHSKNSDQEDGETYEMLGVTETELEGLKGGKGAVYGAELQKLREMELKIQEIETELEIVFRMLVKTRVSLLNILNI